ncbi:hypothetical protein PFAG_02345 [Plasmodium falciparum Santa Lucia]|uniref:Uncharacterized protein n=15 Tax=Plasmodium falciparum TaxID=5833 RepID=Q8I349_PLAF7|nr:conserved protein, unknown function [Plasmodium falciparum 3D7]ETW18495.1 hypothetical protein PFFVO_02394 [Plasmodium falciparum Vietnam Oak-Knoll (FVO)]ETW27634.1 hypothetical protein PFFCH_04917 [Plasmodium falciparum FCH/4]ETW36881.1 hypothetical protein PFTANZ_02463 [Plasmodium falciparum Tanzania (2000708)]ETW43038.1 hypothetical protein PFNF135_02513 [Plasmodium falciparum NF135/5.C10]ETW55039.1 hypothetical protein PFUGPA_02861 [Plasmodium falciparum Palo Alto/Uganda]ETW61701.1 hyp|eukprot:XP_001351975.1 conserved Plasmodium protein, unknown function [Plasmodium falciparum 3D7]
MIFLRNGFFFLFSVLTSCYINLFTQCLGEEFEKIKYPQDVTKIKYYDNSHKIDSKYLYKHVAKGMLQDLIVTVQIDKDREVDKILFLPKKKTYMKIIGDWSDYPKEKNNEICLAFVLQKYFKKEKEKKCTKDFFTSGNIYNVCYNDNNYSIKNLYLYIEISQKYLEKLFSSYSIPVIVNTENNIIYFANDKMKSKEEKPILDLHICYKSNYETPTYLGKLIFNSYPININRNKDQFDIIYTKSFLTNNWDYNLSIKGNYITSYNRVVFVRIPRDSPPNKMKCPPFWDYSVLGSGPLHKIKKKNKNNIIQNMVQYSFSNKNIQNYYIPFLKKDELQTNESYIICLYSDENDFEGMQIINAHFYINTTDSIILIFLIIFIVVFLPLIFSLTYLCVLFKMNILKVKMQKLQLLNRKDEIEDRLKDELNLDQYESI